MIEIKQNLALCRIQLSTQQITNLVYQVWKKKSLYNIFFQFWLDIKGEYNIFSKKVLHVFPPALVEVKFKYRARLIIEKNPRVTVSSINH